MIREPQKSLPANLTCLRCGATGSWWRWRDEDDQSPDLAKPSAAPLPDGPALDPDDQLEVTERQPVKGHALRRPLPLGTDVGREG